MLESRIRVAPSTVAYADAENLKLGVEFAIPGAPTDTIDVKILEDSASKGHRVCFSTGFRLAGETGQSRSNLRERPAPNRGALQRSDGRCCEGRHQSRWRGNQDQNNPSLMTR